MKKIKNLTSRLNGFYQSLAQAINRGEAIRLNKSTANNALTLLGQLKDEVQPFSGVCAQMIEDIYSNLFFVNPDGTLGVNAFRFGKLEAVLQYLNSSDFVCDFAKYIKTPWEDINNATRKLLEDSANAADRFSYNQVGVLGREIYILLGTKVYKPEMNNRADGRPIGTADAKGMLESFIEYRLKGKSNEDMREYADKAVKLAEPVTHTKTEDRKSMETLVTAVIALVALINTIYKN